MTLLIAGCTAGGAKRVAGGLSTLVVAYNNKISTLDPLRADYTQGDMVMQGLYDTLVGFDRNDELGGRLATRYEVASDAREITFELRPGVRFHDGTLLTAKDVAYSLDRYRRLGQGVASYLTDYAGTEVQDDRHFTIRLKRPNSLFLAGLSQIYVLNSELVRQNAGTDDGQGWLSSHDAGSGPYMLGSEFQGDTIKVSRNQSYWAYDGARPERLIYRLITESATQRDELRIGNLDLAPTLTTTDAASLSGTPGVTVRPFKSRIESTVVFNMVSGPTTNPVVRKAIQLAYDYRGGLREIRGDSGALADGPLPTTMSCRADLPKRTRNVAAARSMLADAGIRDLTLTMSFQSQSPIWKQEATLLQSNLRDIGITLNLEPISFSDYLARLSDHDRIPQMMLLEDFSQLPVAGDMLSKEYSSTAHGTNRSGYANPRVDRLLERARASSDEATSCGYYREIQKIVDRDVVSMTMYTLFKPYGFQHRVRGVHPAAVGSGPWIPDLRMR